MRPVSTALAAAVFLAAAPCAQAALTPRVAHTATLLPTGDILITGGMDESGAILSTTELRLSATGQTYTDGPDISARSSHTATMMANGCVLIAGGWNGAATRSDYRIYDPATNTVSPNTGGLTARYNHTATSLNNGQVLLCGGQNDAGVIATCDLFTPSGATGNNCSGTIAPTGSLQLGRALHTAVLLKDGKVWFAGGIAASGYTPTTERYDPSLGSFNSAQTLGEARAYHTATMMGDGKVLVAGGYNANENLGNAGILDTLEVYDPVANTVTSGPRLSARRKRHSAVLSPDGTVMLLGGLGNITTTYIDGLNATLDAGSLTNTWAYPNSSGTITGTSLPLPLDFDLDVPVAGKISDGHILFSSPTATFASGIAYFTPGLSKTAGLSANLAGVSVYKEGAGGHIAATLSLSNMSGRAYFTPKDVSLAGNASGSLTFAGTLDAATASKVLTGGTIDLNVTIPMSPELTGIGATVIAGTIALTGGTIIQASSYTATITGGTVTIPSGTAIDGNGDIVFVARAVDLTGTIEYKGTGAPQQFTGAPMTVPQGGSQANASLTGVMSYVASKVNLAGAQFAADVATVVIRGMVFGQAEFYNPAANQATFTPPGGSIGAGPAVAAFGHTATLLPNTDLFVAGGYDCSGASCASFAAKNSGAVRSDLTFLPSVRNFSATSGSLLQRRAYHTATLLPDNTILVAGGTNGPSVLPTAEIFNPASGAFAATRGSMRDARDLHTATLLPNGRVLVAGGYSTNATSTGSTNSAEIYYPDTKIFIPAAMMISSRSNHTATLLPDGNLMVFGGFGPGDVITATAEIYYSTSGAWKPLTSAPAARALHAAALLKDGRLMVAGGVNSGGVLSSVHAYTPATNSWAALAPMPVALRSHTATLLFDGRVLVAGGNGGLGQVNASYIYDPKTDAWTATAAAPLTQPRFGHTATLLPDNTVMISGGATLSEVPTGIEVYRVDSSSWVPTGGPFALGARAFHTMTLAADGKVYAIGGSDGLIGGAGTSLLSSAEQGYFTADADVYTKNAPPSIRRSTITATSATPFLPGGSLSVSGLGFRGGTEASGGGSGAANSSFSFPQMSLLRTDGGGFAVDLTSPIYKNSANLATLDTSLSVALPPVAAQLPTGWYNVRVGANGVYSHAQFLQAGPAKPALAPTNVAGLTLGVSSISWTWTGVAGIDGYNVYNATSGIFLSSIPTTSLTYVQTELAPSATASIMIAGYTLSGDGPLSASATAYTLSSLDISLSTLPLTLTVSAATLSNVILFWSTNAYTPAGTIYEVSQSSDDFVASFSTPVPAGAALTSTFTTISHLTANTTYYFRVRAFSPDLAQLVAYSNSAATMTFNGGAAPGSLMGAFLASSDSSLSGSLGNGRQILLRAPARAFPTDVAVTISSFVPIGTLCPNATNIAFSIVSSPALQPIGSLYFTFSYAPSELGAIPAGRAQLLRYEPGSGTCVPLETTVDTAGGQMTARINHFSLFQVGSTPLSTTPETARLFPNPYHAGRDGFVTIDRVPPDARVRIFTLRGEQVLDVRANAVGLLTWSGTNGSGRAVASGVYLVMVESGSTKKILKLAVIR
ncbi:MAG: hypothetical protein HY403_05840 [Elusimicrobia bacterium]|nr:hypothetical protein [Elusimicrobiota bacterium]